MILLIVLRIAILALQDGVINPIFPNERFLSPIPPWKLFWASENTFVSLF